MAKAASVVRESEKNLHIQQDLDKKAQRKNIINTIVPYFGLAFVFLFFVIVTNGKFISANNIENLINQGFNLAIIAVGASFVYARGNSDFSIGATCGCAQLACGLMLVAGYPIWMACLAAILVAVIGSSIVSGITLLFGVPAFIGSMCVRLSFIGILETATSKSDIVVDYSRYNFMNNTVVKAVVLVTVIALGYYLFNYTTFGKYCKAVGGNEITAEQAGVKKKKVVFLAYLALGICVGVAAFFSFFRTGRVSSSSGSGIEFNIMMAIILGGFPFQGGDSSKISAAIVGALTVTFLTNGLQLWGLSTFIISGVKGILFVCIVALSYDRSAGKLVS